jgi:exosortase/archaeosortase family protein
MVNIFRVMAIILCLHYFGYDLSQDSVHTVFGIVIFGLALVMLICFKWMLNRYDSAA